MKVLAVSSAGGHWVQMTRLSPAFEGCDVVYATVADTRAQDVGGARVVAIPDATRWSKVALLKTALRIAWLLLRLRPDVVVSTGAAPGLIAIAMAKLLRMRTVWVDSVANADELSLSGKKAGRWADLWLTQWPHLAGGDGPTHAGSVL